MFKETNQIQRFWNQFSKIRNPKVNLQGTQYLTVHPQPFWLPAYLLLSMDSRYMGFSLSFIVKLLVHVISTP
jgi:hypothetical protein